MSQKSSIRWPALGALAAKIGSLVLVVASDPNVVNSVAGKIGVSAALLTSVIQAITKPLVRQPGDH